MFAFEEFRLAMGGGQPSSAEVVAAPFDQNGAKIEAAGSLQQR